MKQQKKFSRGSLRENLFFCLEKSLLQLMKVLGVDKEQFRGKVGSTRKSSLEIKARLLSQHFFFIITFDMFVQLDQCFFIRICFSPNYFVSVHSTCGKCVFFSHNMRDVCQPILIFTRVPTTSTTSPCNYRIVVF